ncbi:defensin Ec-AMP-D2-like [Olea europaea var. sylvestris]|uniref:defensin Ec-AMP-D2-like n=1 Tax=Olea europaea var. sylvestris TaxID=158386 RepID=UPI000C1D2423|nr:defensin Ec-AMP-D2-like [Olea europaea var. sylvestris]
MGRYAAVFFMLMLVMLTGPLMVAEARTCESQSHRFKGSCVSKSNCAAVCQTEGFPDGYCRGFRRRCFCSKHC